MRHRPILGASGIVLFACLFLPAIRTCGAPDYPLQTPEVIPPYIFGLAFGASALAFGPRARRAVAHVLRVLFGLFALLGAVLVVVYPVLGFIELGIAILLLATLGLGDDERHVADAAIVAGGLQSIWFGIVVATGDAMIGGYLSLLSSLGIAIAGVLWRVDVTSASASLPRAVLRATSRGRP